MDFVVSIPATQRLVSEEELCQGIAAALKEFTGTAMRPTRPTVCWLLNHPNVRVVRQK